MPKVYLSPPYHKWNPCSISGCDEVTHNNQYMDELEPYLKACGIEYKRGPWRTPKSNEDGTAIMNAVIKESNAWKPDIHYVSHTNAYDGTVTGCRPMIYPKNNPKGEKLAEIMTKYRKQIYSGPIIIKRTDQWAELRETTAVAYYEEHVFHDNKGDAQWFHDNMRKIAEITCRGFCEYFGIKFVDPYAKPDVKVEVKQYNVITTINRYGGASEAKKQTNPIGTYSPGVYYIYTKYPDGVDGMFNITKDSSGKTAGSWINPIENVKVESVEKPVIKEEVKEEVKEESVQQPPIEEKVENNTIPPIEELPNEPIENPEFIETPSEVEDLVEPIEKEEVEKESANSINLLQLFIEIIKAISNLIKKIAKKQ